MKAARHPIASRARRSPIAALAATALLAACVPAAKAPAPAAAPPAARPAPRPAAPPPAASLPVPPGNRWMDMPRTAGDWRYGAQGGRSEARFVASGGAPLARLTCLADSRQVVLTLLDGGAARKAVTIRTETASRTLEARPGNREMSVALTASDPLLDAMALSKGQFALEAEGLAPLYLPSFAEISRVIEDCRG